MKKILWAVTALLVLLTAVPAAALAPDVVSASLANFRTVSRYDDTVYTDVPPDSWFAGPVATAYELDLMVGSDGCFDPEGEVTAAETCVIAAKLHRIYYAGAADFVPSEPWYAVFADYCLQNGILDALPDDYDRPLERSEFAAILSRALPASTRPPIREVEEGQIPDLPAGHPYAGEVYELYRAGILSGNDEFGTFAPASRVQRSQVAAILTCMVDPSLRSDKALLPVPAPSYPDLPQTDRQDNAVFTTAAMLGNSLVQGMSLYSGLKKPMDFYCYQGVNVKTVKSYAQELCKKQYDRVYIELGINEIGMKNSSYISYYQGTIELIRQALPDAQIFIMAITPVTKAVNDKGSFTMAKIQSKNDALYQLAKDTGCWYLDICSPLCDDTGYLPDKYAGWDGSPHLSVAGYTAWEEVLRTHCP